MLFISSARIMELSRKLGKFPLSGTVDVDETFVGGQDVYSKERKKGKKEHVVVAVEKKKKGVSRFYAKVIDREAHITTGEWRGYSSLDKDFKYIPVLATIKKAIQNLDGFSKNLCTKAYLMISRKPRPLMIAR